MSASGDTNSNAVEDALLLLPNPTPEPRKQSITESVTSPTTNEQMAVPVVATKALSKSASDTDLTALAEKTLPPPADNAEQQQEIEVPVGVTKVTVNIVK